MKPQRITDPRELRAGDYAPARDGSGPEWTVERVETPFGGVVAHTTAGVRSWPDGRACDLRRPVLLVEGA